MNLTSLQRPNPAMDVPIEKLAGDSRVTESEKVAEVSRQFEAVLLRQILGAAQKKVFAAKGSESVTGGVYQDMVTNQLAETISRSGAIGLARSLNHQLQREVRTILPPASPPPV